MKQEQDKKQYSSPKLQTFGDVRDLTRQNDKNQITDVPIGQPLGLGYSPGGNYTNSTT